MSCGAFSANYQPQCVQKEIPTWCAELSYSASPPVPMQAACLVWEFTPLGSIHGNFTTLMDIHCFGIPLISWPHVVSCSAFINNPLYPAHIGIWVGLAGKGRDCREHLGSKLTLLTIKGLWQEVQPCRLQWDVYRCLQAVSLWILRWNTHDARRGFSYFSHPNQSAKPPGSLCSASTGADISPPTSPSAVGPGSDLISRDRRRRHAVTAPLHPSQGCGMSGHTHSQQCWLFCCPQTAASAEFWRLAEGHPASI